MILDFPSTLIEPSDEEFQWEEEPRVRLAVEEGAGVEQRNVDGINTVPRQFSGKWPQLNTADKDTLRDFLIARGGTEAFRWTPPGEVDPIVVSCGRWSVSKKSGPWWTVSVEFVEEFDHA